MSASVPSMLAAIGRRDLRLVARRWSEFSLPPLFMILVAALFPLGMDPTVEALRSIAPGVAWVAALLAALLGFDLLFRADFEDGSLETLVLAAPPLELVALTRVGVHWLVTGLPLIVVVPVVAAFYAMPAQVAWTLALALALGTPLLSLVGGIAAALTISLRRGTVLLALLVLPLCVPVLVFGSRAVALSATGFTAQAPLYSIAAMSVLALTLAPFAIAAALRINME